MLRGNLLGATLRGGLGLNGIIGAWLREVRANDANPALTINQVGTGKTFDFQRAGSTVMEGTGSYIYLRQVTRIPSSLDIRLADDSDYKIRMQATTSPYLLIYDDKFFLSTAKTPASATAAGTQGWICWDASYIYVCIATNTWVRAALSSW